MTQSKSFDRSGGTESTGSTVFGMFRQRSEAEAAISALKQSGFDDDRISVAMRDKKASKSLQEDTGTEAAEGAAAGAVAGGAVGGTLGLLAGIGAIAIPGIGPIVAAGWLGSTLVGAGVGAAAGGIIGGLVGMGVPEEDARRFDASFREGGILVAVEAAGRTDDAAAILRSRGADVSGADVSSTGTSAAGRRTAENTDDLHGERTLELREEELDIDTRKVKTGEVNVRKETVTENRTVDVPVTREEVVIERRPADRHAAGGPIGDDHETMRIPVSREEVDVSKRTVAREDVTVGKRQVTDSETVSEPVRHEELRLDEKKRTRSGSYTGKERRRGMAGSYSGPERRQAQI